MINQKFSESGLHPAVAYLLGVACFIALVEYLFYKTQFANYILLLAVLSLFIKASEVARNEFLSITFGNKKSRSIRIIENTLISLPFSIVLIYHGHFIEAIMTPIVGSILACFTFKSTFNYTIPTPFFKQPFEFTVGFRRTLFILPIAFVLTAIAISVDNFNLGIFSLLLIFMIAMTYYSAPENEYFVWTHALSPKQFIFSKIKTGTKYVSYLALPTTVILVGFNPGNIELILMFTLVGYAFLWTIILAKYSVYPNEIGIQEGILIAFCTPVPPLLLPLMLYFYSKSIKTLNTILKSPEEQLSNKNENCK